MNERYYFKTELSAYCFAHAKMSRGWDVVGYGIDEDHGDTPYWVEIY